MRDRQINSPPTPWCSNTLIRPADNPQIIQRGSFSFHPNTLLVRWSSSNAMHHSPASLICSSFAIFAMAVLLPCLDATYAAPTASGDHLILTDRLADATSLGLPTRQDQEKTVRRLLRHSSFRSTYAANLEQLEEDEVLISNLRKKNQEKLDRLKSLERRA